MKLKETKDIKVVSSPEYNYIFNKKSGLLMRWGETHEDDPDLAPYGPEILDMEISVGDCSGGCPWCYKGNNPDSGHHMSLETYKKVVDTFPRTLTQVALGLTDITANKDLIDILKYSREVGVIPNFTLAGYGATDKIIQECAEYVGAVAVSVYPHNVELAFETAQKFLDAGVEQTNFHLLYYEENIEFVKKILSEYKEGNAPQVNAVVLLALKNKGRADSSYTPMSQESFSSLVECCFENDIPIGFDSCSAPKFEEFARDSGREELIVYSEPCESSLMSSYVNVHGDFYPCSFVEGTDGWEEGISVVEAEDFLQDVWYHPRVGEWRETLLGNCRNCPVFDI